MKTTYRHRDYIRISPRVTAKEEYDSAHTLIIRKNGKIIEKYRDSSLIFSDHLIDEDISYLRDLAEWAEAVN